MKHDLEHVFTDITLGLLAFLQVAFVFNLFVR